MTKQEGLLKEREAATIPAQQAYERAIAQRQMLMTNPIPSPPAPRFYDIKPPPNQKFLDPIKAFANPLVFMTVLGSLAVRRGGGLAAMKAATEAINGFHKGDQEAMKQQMDNWHEATDAVIKQNNIELSRYNAAWKTTEHNVGERQAKLEAIAASTGDEVKLAALRAGNLDGFNQLLEQQRQHTEKMEELNLRYGVGAAPESTIQGLVQRALAGEDIDKLSRALPGSGPVLAENKNRLQSAWTEAAQQKWGPNWATTYGEVKARYQAQLPAARSVATRVANLEYITRNVNAAIPQAIQTSLAVPRGNWVRINELVQKGASEISDPALKAFRVANLQLSELWARAMNPTGVKHEADQERVLNMLSTADGPEAYKAAIQQVVAFVQRERQAAIDQLQGKEVEPVDVEAEYEKARAGGYDAPFKFGAGGVPAITNFRKVTPAAPEVPRG